MNYQKIYQQFIEDRRRKEPSIYRSLPFRKRAKLGATITGQYIEHHHIEPRSLGGSDDPDNIISLTAEDHIWAHLLLAKIHGGVLWYPINMLTARSKGIPTRRMIKIAALAKEKAAKARIKWRKEDCLVDALQYESRSEWNEHSSGYQVAAKHGWLDECCKHMDDIKKPNGYWTKGRCRTDAKQYNTRTEWQDNNASAYSVAAKNDWLDECCQHMVAAERPRKWTKEICQIDAKQYKTRTAWKTNSIDAYTAAVKYQWLDECCQHMVLKKKPAWTMNSCKTDALQYQSKSEWEKHSPSAIAAARKNDWLDQCCQHMIQKRKAAYSLKSCKQDAKQYQSKSEWEEHSASAYNAARRNDWLDECCQHMVIKKRPNGYWTKERCQDDARNYSTKKKWETGSPGAYHRAAKSKWIIDCCEHMVEVVKPVGYWTKERCQSEALQYNTRTTFNKGSSGAYDASYRNGWLDDICRHMN
jgi:hypothetical protein